MKRLSSSLFARLLFYFLIVMIVPFFLFMVYYLSSSGTNLKNALQIQAESSLQKDANQIGMVLEEYRHKCYQISIDPAVISAVEKDAGIADDEEIKNIYNVLFSTMRSDTYRASANIVSLSGKVRISTHNFPEIYDLRTHSNQWDSTNIISIANQKAKGERASIISIEDHRTEEGKQIFASILRRIFSPDGDPVGYVIVDIYNSALGILNTDNLFSELVIADKETYSAYSLIHQNLFGSFANIPELSNEDSTRFYTDIEGTDFFLIAISAKDAYTENLEQWTTILIISLVVGLVISVFLSLVFSHSISRRLKSLSSSMKKIEEGNLDAHLETTGISDFDTLSKSFNVMVSQIKELLEITREEEAKLSEAERKALESQMNPHFLFNTLNTIKALAKLNGEKDIYTISVKLGKLLRSSIDTHESTCTLFETIDLVESYLMIQKIRFGDKLNYEIICPQELKSIITPRLMLQPLVENSVIHGLEPKSGDWHLKIEIKRDGSYVFFSVWDDGIGFEDENIDLEELFHQGHVGIYNVYRRLFLKYGDKLVFKISSKLNEYTEIIIGIPYQEEEI